MTNLSLNKSVKDEFVEAQHLQFQRLRSYAATGKVRSTKWLKYIRSLVCIKCENPNTEPHHIFGSYGSLKTSDFFTVPVCRNHHIYFEANPKMNYGLIEEWIKLTHNYLKENYK